MSEKIDRIKKHFVDNKKTYIVGGVGVAIGVAVGVVICKQSTQIAVANPAVVNWKPVSNIVQVQMVRPGPKSFVVQCIEDQRVWPSLRAAADDLGVHPNIISKHLKGAYDTVKDLHLEKVAEL